MVQKRVFAWSLFLLICIAISVQAFGGGGGGGGGGSGGTGTYIPTYSFEQGGSVTIAWYASPTSAQPCESDGQYLNAICRGESGDFNQMHITIYNPSGAAITSWTESSNSGSRVYTLPRNAPIGLYTIYGYGSYDNDAPEQGSAYESGSKNNKFLVYATGKDYQRGETVVIGWGMESSYEDRDTGDYYSTPERTYSDGSIDISVTDPSGATVYTCSSGTVNGNNGGACQYTIAGNAAPGRYSIRNTCNNCASGSAADTATARDFFNVIANDVPAGNNPGDACGTGSTCNNGLTCQGNVCKNTNVGTGGGCNTNSICTSGLTCTNGVCTNPNVNQPATDQALQGFIDDANSAGYATGWARDPDWQGPGQYIDVHFYVDGPAGSGTFAGAITANTPSEPAVGGNGAHRYAFRIPAQFWDGRAHTIYAYGIGINSQGAGSGQNLVLGGSPKTFTYQPQTNPCTSFTYSGWSACVNGQQSKTVTGSSPNGCSGGDPGSLTQTCTGGSGTSCTTSSQCSSPLVCQGNTCVDPTPQTHKACVNQQCATVNGAGADSCSLTSDCFRGNGGQCDANYGCTAGLQCTIGYCELIPTLTSATWTDLTGSIISAADKEDTVMINAQGSNINGRQITFATYKKSILLDSKIDERTVTASGNTANFSLKISTAGTYYIKASASFGSQQSSDLVMSDTIVNSPPVAVISTPQSGAIYFTSNSIPFAHTSYDVDDAVASDSWKFGDGSGGTGRSTTHTYTSAGQKVITLEVTDSRGAKASTKREIVLANPTGYTIYVGIEKPASQEAVKSNNLVAEYAGRSTYIISTTSDGQTPCTVTAACVQGQCPATTQSSPLCAANQGAAIPVTGGQKGYEQLLFNWTFKDSSGFLSSDSGIGKVSGTKGFADYGPKNITATVKFTAQGMSATVTREFLLLNQRQCSASGTTWYKINNGFVTENRDTLSTIACAGLDLQAGTNDDCCPAGFTCSTSGTVGCKLDDSADLGCNGYTTQTSCIADASQRVRNEPLWEFYNCGSSSNGQNILCSCGWNAQSSKCEFAKNTRPEVDPITGTTTSCSYTTQTSECVNGYQNVQIDASGDSVADPLCTDSTQILPCGRPVVALPFLGGWQIIAIALVIIGTYFAMNRINKADKKTKAKSG